MQIIHYLVQLINKTQDFKVKTYSFAANASTAFFHLFYIHILNYFLTRAQIISRQVRLWIISTSLD